MSYLYIKAIHIIFIVTWFAGLFYMPRFFIYNTEANDKDEVARKILQEQFGIMMKRLWYLITWPSAILTLIFGLWTLFESGMDQIVFEPAGKWLLLKLIFVVFLYVYHFSLHVIFKQQLQGIYKYSSMKLRLWNEVATVFLISIVFLVVVKQNMSFVWGLVGLFLLVILLMLVTRIYKKLRVK